MPFKTHEWPLDSTPHGRSAAYIAPGEAKETKSSPVSQAR